MNKVLAGYHYLTSSYYRVSYQSISLKTLFSSCILHLLHPKILVLQLFYLRPNPRPFQQVVMSISFQFQQSILIVLSQPLLRSLLYVNPHIYLLYNLYQDSKDTSYHKLQLQLFLKLTVHE